MTQASHPATAASDLKPRVGPVDGIHQSLILAGRTLLQIRHNPYELLDFSLQPILFLLLFTYVFGGAVAGGVAEYLAFVLPGIIVMNMFFVTVYVGLGLNNDLTKGVFDRFRALPIARWAPLAGRITADMVKQAWSVVLLLVVGVLMGFRVETHALGVVGALALVVGFALAFSWVSVLIGVLARDAERVQVYGYTALFPITFVSSAFVPAETMPEPLQPFVVANPVTVLTEACRGLLVGGPVAEPTIYALLWAVGIGAVFGPLSVWAFKRKHRH